MAVAAGRAGSLTRSGQWAATLLGTAVTIAGWGWAALLIGYFITSSALTRMGRTAKAARTASMLPDAEARTATQVYANGGAYGLGVVLGAALSEPAWAIAGGGALAAAILGASLAATAGIALAGLAGSVGDSLLGATLQSKRWCDRCRAWTEREVHSCGTPTAHRRGVRWVTNDTVNLLATVVGALVALALVPLR